jgi:hypothetical protein
MLLSHSCDVNKLSHLLVAPAYLDSELSDAAILTLRPGIKDPKSMRKNLLSNEVMPFFALPAMDITGKPGGEQILVCLHLGVPVPQNVVVGHPVLNFTEWDHPISCKRDHFGASIGSYAFARLVSTDFFSLPR